MDKLKIDLQVSSDETLLDEMKQAYLNCPSAIKYCKDLGISDELIDDNIVRVYDFVCDLNYCKNCPGCKKCQKDSPTIIRKIVFNGKYVDVQLVPCKKLIDRLGFEKQFLVSDFDEEWIENSIKEDLDQTKERKQALVKYKKWVDGLSTDWLYLTGGQSSGRSYVASMLVVDAARKNKGPVCFLNSSKRIAELNDLSKKTDKSEFERLMKRYSFCPILVFDDFGNEYKNDFIRDSIVSTIISERSQKRLFTIFTSDFTIDEIETLYSTNKAAGIMAKRLSKFIKGNAKEEINLGDLPIY